MPRKNGSVVSKLKDELNGEICSEFVGLRAKLYSYMLRDGTGVKKSKGVKSSVVAREITHEDYKKCLFEKITKLNFQNTIQSKNHNLFTIKRQKISITPHDDKRVEIEDFNTKPYGYME